MKCVFIPWLLLLGIINIITAQYFQNVAVNKPCNMSSRYTEVFPNNDCSKAVNNNTGTTYEDGNCIHTAAGDRIPSWTVDLGDNYTVRSIIIYGRADINIKRMANIQVTVDNTDVYKFPADTTNVTVWNTKIILQTTAGSSLPKKGRYLKLSKNTADDLDDTWKFLNFCEVQVGVCSPGYYGPNCISPCKSECTALPCDDIANPNSCTDPCESNPCQHDGGTCQRGAGNKANTYTCQCAGTGYQGPTCQQDIDECRTSNPCRNGGTCANTYGSYTCTCTSGYTGTNCETDIDECLSVTCDHGGTCMNTPGSYNCVCSIGYTGKNCETDINYCSPNPCLHGQCTDLETSYTCDCEPGYTDITCSTDIDDCVSGPCINGTCSDRVNSFACTCYVGYEGNTCEEEPVSAGLVAGVAVGGMVLGAAILGVVGFLWLRRRSRGAQDSPTSRHRDGSKVTRDSNSRTSSTAADYEDVGEHTGPRQQEEQAVEYYSSANPDQVHLSPTKGKNRVTKRASPAIGALDEGATAKSPYYNTALDHSDEGFPSQTAATSSSPSATAESNYEEFGARGIYDRPEMYENRMEHHVYTGLKKK